MKSENIFDKLTNSAKDAFSFSHIIMRIIYIIFFGFILALRSLIKNLDVVGKSGSGLIGFLKALMLSMWQGVGIALSSIWQMLINFNLYTQTHAYGSLAIGIIMGLAVIGVLYQPISLIINLFDMKGKSETGDKHGNATSGLVRLTFTVVIVLILSAFVFYTGISEPILNDGISQTNTTLDATVADNTTEEKPLIVSIDMLTGDGG